MNGLKEFVPICGPKESRPPVLGREVIGFYESSRSYPDSCASFSKISMEHKELQCESDLKGDAKDINNKHTASENAMSEAGACMEQYPNPSPPPPYKWAQNLQCLLDDMQGVELFQRFLTQEGQDTRCLDFLFACRGVKKTDPMDAERLHRLVHVLYEKKVKRINAINDETKREIKRKISSRTEVDVNIFDDAQHQVEMDILNTTYPNFLQSDLYIHHLGISGISSQSEVLPERDCPASPEEQECLPTLHEDSELHLSDKQQIMSRKESFQRKLQRFANQSSKARAEAGSSYLKSPYSTNYGSYHARYGSFLPTSAQDSELQSLSSDAQTDDTMSQTDSSIDYPMSRSKLKRFLKNKDVYVNKDSLNHQNFIPRTQRNLDLKGKTAQEFHELLVKKLNKVAEDQKAKERMSEKLKNIEAEGSRPEAIGCSVQKTSKSGGAVFDSTFFFGPQTEDNDQDILDRHVSRVFDEIGQTPVLSPVCASPPIARPINEAFPPSPAPANAQVVQDLAYTSSQNQRIGLISPFSVLSNAKHKQREHDTRSSDSGAVTEWISNDNLAASSQDSCSNIFMKHAPTLLRFTREQMKRSGRRGCSVNDSASSCLDSGISEVCEPVLPSHSKVAHWLEGKRSSSELEKEWKNSSTSPVLSRSSSSQKAIFGNYRSGESVSDTIHNFAALSRTAAFVPSQPTAQDIAMSALPIPDTTTNLIEARRRLVEDEGRNKIAKSRHASGIARTRQFRVSDSFEDGISHRKQSKKSSPITAENTMAGGSNDITVIGYSYGQGTVPYLTRFHGKNITLRNFKSLLTKKGNFKYYFKKVENAFGTGTVLEEVSDDYAILPLWEGKVFCVIETVDEISTSTEDERLLQ